MGSCPIPDECARVGECFEARRADGAQAAEAEREFYEEQEAAYYADQP